MAASPHPFSHSRLRASRPRPRPRPRPPLRFSLHATLCLSSHHFSSVLPRPLNLIPSLNLPSSAVLPSSSNHPSSRSTLGRPPRASVRSSAANEPEKDPNGKPFQDEEVNDLGVRVALSMLKFYKREISPLMLSSCRYVPTCSEYSMQAYKKYGVVKGTVLTAWRLCRCNPLGGTGYDPPRWFGEEEPYEQP